MSTGKSELFTYMAATVATVVALFGLQSWYGTFIDVSYHAQLQKQGMSSELEAARAEDRQKLASARMPLEQAKQALAQRGRGGFATIKPIQSDDLSAVAGWIHHPAFKPVVAHPIRTPRAAFVETVRPEGASPEGATEPTPHAAPHAVDEASPEASPSATP